MQSSYGGVSEIQQFMVESCGGSTTSLFSNTADIHSTAAGGSNPLKYQAPPPAAVLPPHFAHFHSIPITQQLFQQPPTAALHQFQLFHPHHHEQLNYQPLEPRRMQMPHHQQLGLDQDSGPENSASSARVTMPAGGGGSGPPPSFLAEAMNFKLAVNESSGGGSREGINDEDGILRGDDDGSESRLHHHWPQRDDESSIKELSWRPLDLDIDYIHTNNKRCKNKEPEISINTAGKVSKKSKEDAGAGSSNYKIFSELEAIYKPGGSGGGGGGGVNRTGSGSALTGDETPLLHAAAMAPPGLPSGANCVGGMSETSAGEEAGRPGKKCSNNNRNSSGRRRRKRRRWQRQLSSVAAFFESLVKQLIDHQESLHRKFLEVMENREQERTSREEAWRKQEAAKSCREAAARAHERKLASSREAAIIAFLEKITGESLNLPPKPHFSDEHNNYHENNPQTEPCTEEAAFGDQESNKVQFSSSRWPKTEVQALIRVRSGLDSRFQEPGLKGPLWEEVSATMAAMGYLRSAKRCKEKWENINKYFRKTKESGKKRPQHSKTCPYFQQLDQLYSRSSLNKDNIPKKQRLTDQEHDSKEKHDDTEDKRTDNSELLDAIVVPPAAADYPSLKFGFGFNGNVADENFEDGAPAPNLDDHNGDENEGGEEQGGEEVEGDQEKGEEEGEGGGGGENQDQEPRTPHHLDQEVDEELHDTSLFFQSLQS